MKVLMVPDPNTIKTSEDGISQVVINYGKHAKNFGVDYVSENPDLVAIHAGMQDIETDLPIVSHIHGLHWNSHRKGPQWEYEANKNVIYSIRRAREITVPSSWVAETFQRDMHLTPHIIPHGVNWEDWQDDTNDGGYVLWNKNRRTVTCDPSPMTKLADAYQKVAFVSTFGSERNNVELTGKVSFDAMQKIIKNCGVYLSTTKETGGIGILEAMSAGKPILGFANGAIVDFVQHGVNGYLAHSQDDLIQGLEYCIAHRKTLGENGRELARTYTWQNAMQLVSGVYQKALETQAPTIAIIIPCYNYADLVGRAIQSAQSQTYEDIEIIVVDDGSTDNTKEVVLSFAESDNRINYIYQDNAGVANARNKGVSETHAKYICCLDADDQIEPLFIETCVIELEKSAIIDIAYTKLVLITRDGTRRAKKVSSWPGEFDYTASLQGQNQIPTCCVYNRKVWERLGGYRQRYAPQGCGSEDAEFWLRAGAIGFNAKLVSNEPLFVYTFGGGGTTGNPDYEEIDWLYWHPWTRDGEHPFASQAKPRDKAHPVRFYDEPDVSIIIPVGPNHEKQALNAIDSVEGQTFRNWECIVIWDSENKEQLETYKLNYPFVKWIETEGKQGAGKARNLGVAESRAALITFLDADDWLYPDYLEQSLLEYYSSGTDVAVYTDSVGKAQLSQETVDQAKPGKILFYDPHSLETVIAQKNLDYNCPLAQNQPNQEMYLWCYVTTLHPKEWFYEVGGFDEHMESWEDWDYWIKLAKLGKCFVHLEQELLVYQYYTGNRRDFGIQNKQFLLDYMTEKYKGIEIMPCSGCGGSRRRPSPRIPIREEAQPMSTFNFDSDMILCTYNGANRGDHRVIGHAQFRDNIPGMQLIMIGGYYHVDYKYHAAGDRFLVHKEDVHAAPNLFMPVAVSIPEIQMAQQVSMRPQVTKAPKPLVASTPKVARILAEELEEEIVPIARAPKKKDLQTIPGISSDIAKELEVIGIDTDDDILALGLDGLKAIKGVGDKRADMILSAIAKRKSDIVSQ